MKIKPLNVFRNSIIEVLIKHLLGDSWGKIYEMLNSAEASAAAQSISNRGRLCTSVVCFFEGALCEVVVVHFIGNQI